MWGVVDLPTYLVGLVLIILLPGPNSMYVLTVAARQGIGRGYAAAAGVFTGDAVLMALSAGGVASLLQANPYAFDVVKYLGAGYLAWLAVGLLRAALGMLRERISAPTGEAASGAEAEAVADTGSAVAARPGRLYRRALVISLLNPKAILFFIAFFVQFVDPAYPRPWLSFLVLGAFAELASAVYLTALIVGGHRLASAFGRRRRLAAGGTSVVGLAFLGFAVKLATASAG
ncbi:leucine efflux protein LeuE [Nocardioides sp. TRM66260-LWL]|uniref:leucine efflux protein LeuE n=1 Tax=Nocardioides sp. TRM66260-LWL TaxID=2874478 RepID=UPI001CC545B3|nr:leucine efflux protein LeuE [Nocardioides sp. TRM66260-LWL]MBZ5735947.1 leucine efflux protein LeuE [Nocardioides sp. TRM66260-LWL]